MQSPKESAKAAKRLSRYLMDGENVSILGERGSELLQSLARAAHRQGETVYVLSVQENTGPAWQKVCQELGGQYVRLSTDGEQHLNVLDPFPQKYSSFSGGDSDARLYHQIYDLRKLQTLLAPRSTNAEQLAWEHALETVYKDFGVLCEPPYTPSEADMAATPTLWDVLNIVEGPAPYTAKKLKQFLSGPGKCFGFPSNFHMDSPITVLDISAFLNTKLLPFASLATLFYINKRCMEDPRSTQFCAIDSPENLLCTPALRPTIAGKHPTQTVTDLCMAINDIGYMGSRYNAHIALACADLFGLPWEDCSLTQTILGSNSTIALLQGYIPESKEEMICKNWSLFDYIHLMEPDESERDALLSQTENDVYVARRGALRFQTSMEHIFQAVEKKRKILVTNITSDTEVDHLGVKLHHIVADHTVESTGNVREQATMICFHTEYESIMKHGWYWVDEADEE